MTINTLIIFDVGGVLVRLDFSRMYQRFSEITSLLPEEIQKRFAAGQFEKSRELGDEKTYCDGVRTALGGFTLTDKQIHEVTNLALPGPIDEMIALKRKLHQQGHIIGILSTISPTTHRFLEGRWPEMLSTYGGPRELSYIAGVLKPHPKAYEPFTKAGAQKIVYIEDKSSYLKYPVEELGWTGIQMTGFADWSEPIRFAGSDHQDNDPCRGTFFRVEKPAGVERVLHELGLL